jgi:phosphate starvation-inducible protein PhoH and related proteins
MNLIKKKTLQHNDMSELNKLDQNLIIKKIDNETLNIQVIDNEILMLIVGQFDQNLKQLSKLTNTNIFFRGNSITCKGVKENLNIFCEAIKFLINKYNLTNIIEKEDILLSVKKNMKLKNSNVKSFKQLIKTPRKSVIARSEKQSDYIKALKENNIVMSLGPAGTGKSFLAVSVAVTLLMEKKIERVILSRPAVEAGEKLGFLPGDMKEKVDPYLRPLYDALYELFGADKIDKKIETGEIEIAPLAFMRGRTLKNSFAILDEAQNATETQIKMFLTRIGENSKLVVNGDPSQIDLINKSHSGLIKSKNILKNIEEIKIVEFDHSDVVRHPLVSKIIRAYQSKNINDQD